MLNLPIGKYLKYLCLFSFILIAVLYPAHLLTTMPESVSASISPALSVSVIPDQTSYSVTTEELQANLDRQQTDILSKVNTSLIAPPPRTIPRVTASSSSSTSVVSAPTASAASTGESLANLPSLSLDQIKTQIEQACAVRGCDSTQLYRVMMCESRGTNHINTYYKGIFQFLPSTFYANARRIGLQGANVYNPEHQIQVAAYMFSIGQARQWGCK